jgi:hypothetical protein
MVYTNEALLAQIPPPPSPVTTEVLNKLQFLWPETWYGLFQAISRSVDILPLQQALLGAILPLAIMFVMLRVFETTIRRPTTAMIATLLSPWMLNCLSQALIHFFPFASRSVYFLSTRKDVLPSAIETLNSRISSHRAYRTRRYDVYVPLQLHHQKCRDSSPLKAIFMLPGALVPHTSYSELAGSLSDKGLVVVVASLEPCLLADTHLGANQKSARKIMKKIERELKTKLDWSLMGHSMGAFGVMKIYDQFHKKGINIQSLIILGVAAFINECTDLTLYNNPNTTQILLVQGCDDWVVEMMRNQDDQLFVNFPVETLIRKDIAGGTHSGFASYQDDEVVGISRENQQAQVSNLIQDFLQC